MSTIKTKARTINTCKEILAAANAEYIESIRKLFPRGAQVYAKRLRRMVDFYGTVDRVADCHGEEIWLRNAKTGNATKYYWYELDELIEAGLLEVKP